MVEDQESAKVPLLNARNNSVNQDKLGCRYTELAVMSLISPLNILPRSSAT